MTQSGDLSRCITHEADDSWPELIEVVAYYRKDRRGKRKSIVISADQFFGRGYGAPITGEQLISMIERLRKS